MNSPHKGPVTRKIFHLMMSSCVGLWRHMSPGILVKNGSRMTCRLFHPNAALWLAWPLGREFHDTLKCQNFHSRNAHAIIGWNNCSLGAYMCIWGSGICLCMYLSLEAVFISMWNKQFDKQFFIKISNMIIGYDPGVDRSISITIANCDYFNKATKATFIR